MTTRWNAATLVVVGIGCGSGSPAIPDTAMPDVAADASYPASTLDDSFGDHGVVHPTGTCQHLAVDASDRPLLLAKDAATHVTLSRYTTAGQLDVTFGQAGQVAVSGTTAMIENASLFVLPSGKLLVTGAVSTDGTNYANHALRFAADGTPDATFGTNGDVALGAAVPYAIFGAGERASGGVDLVSIGNAATFTFVRLTAAGALDASFGTGGVASPDIMGIPPGYFPHAAYVADGRFLLSGATFAPIGSGQGPITGHLILVADGALVTATTAEHTQYLSLVGHGTNVYTLHDAYPSSLNAIDRVSFDLVADPSFTVAVPLAFDPIYGLYNGGALAVAPDGALMITNGDKVPTALANPLVRFHADGTPSHSDTFEELFAIHPSVGFCELAYDSTGHPVIAANDGNDLSGTALLARLAP